METPTERSYIFWKYNPRSSFCEAKVLTAAPLCQKKITVELWVTLAEQRDKQKDFQKSHRSLFANLWSQNKHNLLLVSLFESYIWTCQQFVLMWSSWIISGLEALLQVPCYAPETKPQKISKIIHFLWALWNAERQQSSGAVTRPPALLGPPFLILAGSFWTFSFDESSLFFLCATLFGPLTALSLSGRVDISWRYNSVKSNNAKNCRGSEVSAPVRGVEMPECLNVSVRRDEQVLLIRG